MVSKSSNEENKPIETTGLGRDQMSRKNRPDRLSGPSEDGVIPPPARRAAGREPSWVAPWSLHKGRGKGVVGREESVGTEMTHCHNTVRISVNVSVI